MPELREPVLASAPAEDRGWRLLVPVRPLPRTRGGATSGAHVRLGARPLSREGGHGSRGGGWGDRAALAPSHALRPAPGRGRTAPPPAPAYRLTPALTHTHTPSRALIHALPSLLLCLSPPAVWGPSRSPAPRLRHAVSAPAPRFTASGNATERAPGRFQNGEPAPPSLAPGQRLLPASPTNLLVGEPRTTATNPLRRSPDPQPVGRRESRAKPWGILGVVVFLHRRAAAE